MKMMMKIKTPTTTMMMMMLWMSNNNNEQIRYSRFVFPFFIDWLIDFSFVRKLSTLLQNTILCVIIYNCLIHHHSIEIVKYPLFVVVESSTTTQPPQPSSPSTITITLPIDINNFVEKRCNDAMKLHQALNHVVFYTKPPSTTINNNNNVETLKYVPTPSANVESKSFLFDRCDLLRLGICNNTDSPGIMFFFFVLYSIIIIFNFSYYF